MRGQKAADRAGLAGGGPGQRAGAAIGQDGGEIGEAGPEAGGRGAEVGLHAQHPGAHTRREGVRNGLRGATESTTSGKSLVWWTSGAPAPDFPIGTPAVCSSGRFPFLARALEGEGLGHHGTSPALVLSDDLPGTPRVTTCPPAGETCAR